MNILVTGANGQLGNHIKLIADQYPYQWFFTDVEELDITDAVAIESYVAEHSIDTVINCAAYTNVEQAEDDEIMADRLNHLAVGYLAEAMHKVGGTLIHVSTDYVFGGNKSNTPCAEAEPVNPIGAYGRTKLAGEQAVMASGCNYVIVRTAWLYSEFGKNFLKTMLSLTATKPSLNVVFDQVGTPTYAGDLAHAICHIITTGHIKDHQGIYHYSNEGVCSWFDFTKEIARQSGNLACHISPCHSNEFPSKAQRPSYSVLDKTKIKATFGVKVPYWTDALAVCLNNMNSK